MHNNVNTTTSTEVENSKENEHTQCPLIEDMIRLTFWDKLEEDLKEEKYEHITILLEEIRDNITDFTPYRADLIAELHENIDVDFARQIFKNDVIDKEYIYKLVNYIITKLKLVDSVEDEPYYETWRTSVNEKLVTLPLHEVLPKVLMNVYERVAKIDYGIKAYNKRLSFNSK